MANLVQTTFTNPTAVGQFYGFIGRQGYYLAPGQSYTVPGNVIEDIRANYADRRLAISNYVNAGIVTVSTSTNTPVTVPTVAGLAVNDSGSGERVTAVTFTNVPLSLTLNTGVIAYSSQLLFTAPLGYNIVRVSSVNITVTNPAVTGVANTYTGAVGLGTAAATNVATLIATAQNLVPSISMSAAVAGVNSASGYASALDQTFNGTVTATKFYLNLLIDATSAANVATIPTAMLINGSAKVTWLQA